MVLNLKVSCLKKHFKAFENVIDKLKVVVSKACLFLFHLEICCSSKLVSTHFFQIIIIVKVIALLLGEMYKSKRKIQKAH